MKPILLKVVSRLSWLLLLLLMMNKSQAQTGTGIVLKKSLEGARGQLVKDSVVAIQDSIYFDAGLTPKLDTPYLVRNIVTFRLNEHSNFYIGVPFTATLKARVFYTGATGGENYTDQDFVINYDTAGTYTMRRSFVFNNAHKVRVQVMGITHTAGKDISPVLVLDNEMEVHPKYKLECNLDAVKEVYLTTPDVPEPDELVVSWPAIQGADVYDLEWAYVDSSALESGRYGNPVMASKIFANNTTRVTVPGNTYAIPLLYDKIGVLYFRVRAVQEKSNDVRWETAWSSSYSSGFGKFIFNGHQSKLNWQSSISFAEDGKRKVVVQYFDGSLRSRQTVTKENTTNTITAAESFYDYQGRPVIQVLPAPTLDKVIKYTRNLNSALNRQEYDKDQYDYLAREEDFLNAAAAPMDTTSGANWYYSPANKNNYPLNKYIPDAEGFAFTETSYTQDNTGRISRQSGVGPTFKLGSGHETEYSYNTPTQEELDAMFGTEVGLSSHYFKNAVTDANGQVSVSYTDMHGRTIATALAGRADNLNLEDLDNKISEHVTDSLSGAGKNTISERGLESQYALLVPKPGDYTFSYQLTPPVLKKKDCNGLEHCYIGSYDLKITITDDAFNQRLGGEPYVITLKNYNALQLTNNCEAPAPITATFKKLLPKGSYIVTKQLIVSKQVMDFYRDSIFLPGSECITMDSLIRKKKLEYQQLPCGPACGTCDSAKIEQDDILKAMLQDVSPPSGQYARSAEADKVYSIFYGTGRYNHESLQYLNAKGEPMTVTDPVTGKLVTPQTLTPADFANAFQPSWANTLLRFHPEYCKLEAMRRIESAQRWIKDFEKVDSYAEAKQKGYLNPMGMSEMTVFPIVTPDPLPAPAAASMKNKLKVFQPGYSLWAAATQMVMCVNKAPECAEHYKNNAYAFNDSIMCAGDLDMAWRSFRNLYLAYRRQYILEWLDGQQCPYDARTVINWGKTTRFNNAADAARQANIPITVKDRQELERQMDSLYESNCRAYVANWVKQLAPCKYDTTALKEIMEKMVAVCKAGSDSAHPRGASSVSPAAKNPRYHSFEEVLKDYNDKHEITDPLICNTELITIPRPYDKQVAMGDPGKYTRPKDCECENLANLKMEYQQRKGSADTTLAAYLKRVRNIKISQYTLDQVINACNESKNDHCTYYSKPISIPAFLDCGVAPSCVPCKVTDSLVTTFQLTYPGLKPAVGSVDSVQVSINLLFAKYMNNRLGYTMEAWEYLKFIDSCGKVPSGSGKMVCVPGSAASKQQVRTFMNGNASIFRDVRVTSDNGFVMAGSTTINNIVAAYIVKTNETGDLLWGRTYGGDMYDVFNKITPTRDGGYIAIGTTNSNCYDNGAMLVVKVDAYGDVLWNKVVDFGSDHGGEGKDVLETAEGDIALAGLRRTGTAATDWVTGVLTNTGELRWMKQTGSSQTRKNISLTERGNTLIAASSIMEGSDYDAVILKINKEDGQQISSQQYDIDGKANTTGNILAASDGYKLALSSGNNSVLMDIAENGGITAARQLPMPAIGQTDPDSWTIAATADGGVIAAHANIDAYWYKFNAGNNLEWNRRGVINGQTEQVRRVVQHPDGTYAAAGESQAAKNHGLLMRANKEGRTGCNDATENIVVTDIRSNVVLKAPATQTTVNLNTNNISTVALRGLLTTPIITAQGCPGIDSCFLVYDGPMLCGNVTSAFEEIEVPEITACSDTTIMSETKGMELYFIYRDSIRNDFDIAYISAVLGADKLEQFAVSYTSAEYQHTLYYYDQAGNLVKTVPPAGVKIDRSKDWTDRVANARKTGQSLTPEHGLITDYRYNTLNQVVAQHSPDGGTSHFWYDRLGRLAVSQNLQQAQNNAYSYTLYDGLGRITEVGELLSSSPMNDAISRSAADLAQWVLNAGSNRSQITRTVYDLPYTGDGPILKATNLRNRVSWSAVYNSITDTLPGNQASASFYSYDIHGNVRTLVQEYNNGPGNDGNRFKRIDYGYDLVSGKVNNVSYQRGMPDAFYHRYSYDAENRLTDVETSRDSVYWEKDARYQYYKHGPLARTVIGQQQVQGLDYAYTLQGWLKGVNSTALTPSFDMGHDGAANGITAKDAFGFSLHYFGDNDYKPLDPAVKPFASAGAGLPALYNGNIAGMTVNLPKAGVPLFYTYTYDILNRLKAMKAAHNLDVTTNTWSPITVDDFAERITYDPNGNIRDYNRNGNKTWAGKPLEMDQLSYTYTNGTNRLLHIKDQVAKEQYDIDIDSQDDNNYAYDSIGNLVHDKQAGVSIKWNVYGKISQITKDDNTQIYYTYDVAGNRISKKVGDRLTRYVWDASGNVMSVYESGNTAVNNGHLTQSETHLYGSGRLGISNFTTLVDNPEPPTSVRLGTLGSGTFTTFTRGDKFFELGNHLGNVLATVGDDKRAVAGTGGVIDHYEANIVSAQDYYPFGMMMAGRKWSAGGGYRYGFNGQENDNEVKGEGNQQDYGMRIYDPRTGRFLSVDPLTKQYPHYTPYSFAGNKPIAFVDVNGAEEGLASLWSRFVRMFISVRGNHSNDREAEAERQSSLASGRAAVADIAEKSEKVLELQGNLVAFFPGGSTLFALINPKATKKDVMVAGGLDAAAVLLPGVKLGKLKGTLQDKFISNFDKAAKKFGTKWADFSSSWEIHHIIPKGLADHPLVKKLTKAGLFDIEGLENGTILPKYSSTRGLTDGMHASHPEYNKYVANTLTLINDDLKNSIITLGEARQRVSKMNEKIINAFEEIMQDQNKVDKRINEYFRELNESGRKL
ncbi:RHS repeat-associated core domain-containing protein [Chitinophaga qingshengii]|uniref:AHH domain-containing protein n=1 Tax=Chitinophaga qingshengii TaxID=1569794 RepID=A0ABR7TIQ5_9BACT|nr:RHS repeat-associated core domain-containing protein [Chitinophaga qingshengii]MBC9929530.1 AHH domain-containing protein [Chitinophaga qingshengii]